MTAPDIPDRPESPESPDNPDTPEDGDDLQPGSDAPDSGGADRPGTTTGPTGDPLASPPPITLLLRRVTDGDRSALDLIYGSLYPDLRRVARSRLAQQGRADSMNTTTLVHESFMRLVRARDLQIADRHHFFAYAAKTMRSVIIDAAREHLAERRGGGAQHVTLSGTAALQVADHGPSAELVRVNDALGELEQLDPQLAQVVEMRYFGGYSEAEIAELQQVTERTVRRRWDKARAWLFVALGDAGMKPATASEAQPALLPEPGEPAGDAAHAAVEAVASVPLPDAPSDTPPSDTPPSDTPPSNTPPSDTLRSDTFRSDTLPSSAPPDAPAP